MSLVTPRGDDVVVTCSLFQVKNGGSIPTSPHQLKLSLIEKKEAALSYLKWHYFGSKGFLASHNFGVFFEGELVGSISYGIPNARNIKGFFDSKSQSQWLELTRLALSPVCPKNSESRVIAISLKLLQKMRPSLLGVITYADTAQGHTGGIYRASNFKYHGLTAQKSDLFVNGKPVGKLKGVKYSELKGEWVKRSRKHLFSYVFNNPQTYPQLTLNVR